MTAKTSSNHAYYRILVPVVFLALLAYVASSITFPETSIDFSLALTADLIFTTPLVYFLAIRKTQIPKLTVVPVFILGIVVGTLFLPKEQQTYLGLVKTWVLPVIELTVITFVFLKFRALRKPVRADTGSGVDFYTSLKAASTEILPKRIAVFFATELAVFYYAIFKWRVPKLKSNEFTNYKETGTRALLYALVGVVLIETTVGHILISRWSPTAAWILTVLSIYTGFQVLGFVKSFSHRPISVNKELLKLRYGLLAEADIPLDNIVHLESLSWKSELEEGVTSFSPLGDLDGQNLVLHLKAPQSITGFYGKTKMTQKLAIHVDQKQEFLATIIT
ncbi:MAG: hypothetical protein ACI9IP_002488 [Arcticibacterium sp.]|jgi:hypothetical protein